MNAIIANKKIGVLATSRHFVIDQSMVSQWISNKEKLKNANSSNRCVGARRASFYPEAEEELVKWLNELHLAKIAVTAEVWADISVEMVIKSFKKCGISNELDGTEDDLLYNSNKENDDNEDLAEIVGKTSFSAEELDLED
ncbi:17210_t:CDS:2 [Dentiscutata heterogama]|uniref:17210_t:CDS:1 n=1 Tax=Dentiscutata heterogama TaxID=1316150 RepID=A0ACA9L1G5_9GLOM|nr:17210_t:CDS:2 [Dentiscutata heterogama]